MRKSIFVIFMLLLALPCVAQANYDALKAKADKSYAEERYDSAALAYAEIVKAGESSTVYYNLGNCYYRMDSIANAILWYERALLLSPGDSDIRFNLQMARSKTIDKIVPEEEIFFSRWYHSLLNMMSVNGWVWTGIVFFVLFLVGLSLYFVGKSISLRKCGFYGAAVMLVVAVVCNVFSWQQKERQQNRNSAVVMTGSVVVKSTPNDTGTDLFVLHAGTTMTILDKGMKDWCQIRLSDGKEGWIPNSEIEII